MAVTSPQLSGLRRMQVLRPSRHPRGVALLMVLALLALLGSTIADFQFASRVDIEMAYSGRDALQAEYNALSALRMRALILKQARKLEPMAKAMANLGGGQAPPLAQILQLIPVECGLMNAITRRVSADIDSTQAKSNEHEDFFLGECMATSESEHAKIPINLLRSNTQNRATQVAQMLLGLLADPRLRKNFEVDDNMGSHATSPLELVQSITDWIDSDHTEALNLGDEDRRYQSLREPYRAKNAPFDSVAELQLVFGINDTLYRLLRDSVTIYTDDPAIELSTAPAERIVLWGLPASLKDGVGFEQLAPALPSLLVKLRALSSLGTMVPMTSSILNQVLQQSGVSQLIDPRKMQQVFSDSSSTTWYTIVAEGRMNKATRRMRAVFQASEGQIYYMRLD